MELLGIVWNEVIIRPMVNVLMIFYYFFAMNMGWSIIIFTLLMKIVMIPLTLKQGRQMKAMAAVQPKILQLQERYKDDKAKVQQETLKMYRQSGVNPVGCLGPMILQMPIFIGLFWALRGLLAKTPEGLVKLSDLVYASIPYANFVVPVDSQFFWMDLGKIASQNTLPFLMPVLVGVSTWLMQKMSTTPVTTPQSASTNRMMLWMMPIMFGYFTLNFETGLALYWVMSNIAGIIIQGFITGWKPLYSVLQILRITKFTDSEEKIESHNNEFIDDEELQSDEKTTNRDRSEEHRRSRRDRNKRTGRGETRRRNKRNS